MTQATTDAGFGIVHARMRVTLTGTTNPYLQPRLPLVGDIEVLEVGNTGQIIKAGFRELENDGGFAALVEVAEPSFAYAHGS
ncbi:hypothetical protein [Kutzneria chonburiensis]|uniref:DUF35 domain-containing protein n=1 Tax=Kutzneria chonburiensis TaxID=1483604 RepID=A0ABV6N3A9_9PSEU|nr:hypothetical protein [Kutzneria chonburiensis]